MKIEKYSKFAPVILRAGLSLVFLWFGINQLINPELFSGYVPQWISFSYITALIIGNGVFEIIFGLLLLIGLYTRITSFLLSLHLMGIAFGLGYNDIAVRDLGLSLASFSIFLNGPDFLCLDVRKKKMHNRAKSF